MLDSFVIHSGSANPVIPLCPAALSFHLPALEAKGPMMALNSLPIYTEPKARSQHCPGYVLVALKTSYVYD